MNDKNKVIIRVMFQICWDILSKWSATSKFASHNDQQSNCIILGIGTYITQTMSPTSPCFYYDKEADVIKTEPGSIHLSSASNLS